MIKDFSYFMYDVLILEDDESVLRFLKAVIPKEYNYKIVKDGKTFENYLDSDNPANLYFLDDRVSDSQGRIDSHFEKHCDALMQKYPNSKVFYIGNAPLQDIIHYCKNNFSEEIEMIEKASIPNVLQEYILITNKD
jgi:DNA-binding NtrC family response regulator